METIAEKCKRYLILKEKSIRIRNELADLKRDIKEFFNDTDNNEKFNSYNKKNCYLKVGDYLIKYYTVQFNDIFTITYQPKEIFEGDE